ncbi:aldo/keto reductase [Tolypothrix sp. FACHB-123]|uniref:aldo/keto reductase n=1 Tax=Tolypothrix sp. FACHB-123 TaxID=2692868 RepID=UPI001685D212|nr:aldo/keto reductase [Tolypothrix sp. FACHB-123]MBD2355221.1 aldo/keto reductase [Tolypothrix sp. FACHB-123]
MKISGKATLEGTKNYRNKHIDKCAPDHFRTNNELIASSIGIGTYLGEADEETNHQVTQAIIECVKQGINLIDSAIIYRQQQGERSIGKALRYLIESGYTSRNELIICTKGGRITEQTVEYINWFNRHYIENNNSQLSATDLIQNSHCIHPEYLKDQINLSLENLEVETIDVYYIHNPEIQLLEISLDVFYNRLYAAFEMLESAIEAGKIAAYGIATWDGLRVPLDHPQHLNLAKIKSIAAEVAGDKNDRFNFIEFPLNMGMPEALISATQNVAGELVPVLEAAYRLELTPIASASLYQAQVIGRIPKSVISAIGEIFNSDCQRALQYTRSAPGLFSALVGMKKSEHIDENLRVKGYSTLTKESFKIATYTIIEALKSMQLANLDWNFDVSQLSYKTNIFAG